jgi:hypothetical protein
MDDLPDDATPDRWHYGLLEIFGSFLRILSVSIHEGERGGHSRSAS